MTSKPTQSIASEVTSMLTEKCQPYQVKMACGHIETRIMRPATAGIPWTVDAVVDNTHGAPCRACRNDEGVR